jgi:hypothetical protein
VSRLRGRRPTWRGGGPRFLRLTARPSFTVTRTWTGPYMVSAAWPVTVFAVPLAAARLADAVLLGEGLPAGEVPAAARCWR